MKECGLRRLKSDANVYVTEKNDLTLMVYVDDLFIMGSTKDLIFKLVTSIKSRVLLKDTGWLTDRTSVRFLGRELRVQDGGIVIAGMEHFVKSLLQENGLRDCKDIGTSGTSASKPQDTEPEETYEVTELKDFRRLLGKLQWLVPVRPDIAFASKELAREVGALCPGTVQRGKRILRYLSGAMASFLMLRPDITLSSGDVDVDLQVFSDSDWAGCPLTRRSTSGFIVRILGSTVVFGSRTQATVATSSAEAELYAIGTSTCEGLHLKHFIEEAGLAKRVHLQIMTDSMAAKAIAARQGVGKHSKHIQLRFLYVQDLVATNQVVIRKVHI